MKRVLIGALAASVAIIGLGGRASSQDLNQQQDIQPDGRGNRTQQQPPRGRAGRAPVPGNGINYHGGPVILGTTNVYYIWYGNWANNASAVTILSDLASNIGGSPYFNINTTYSDGVPNLVSNSVRFVASTTDHYSRRTALHDS